MKYSGFIRDTLSSNNDIRWNYYQSPIDTSRILDGTHASAFIQDYFRTGEKNLPFLLEPAEAEQFINRYFETGRKKLILSFQYDAQHQLPPDRAAHTVSGFFLGLLIEHCLNGTNTLSVRSQRFFPFSYLWFLTFLYHDYGYCIAERRDQPNPFPMQAPLPDLASNNPRRVSRKEYYALSRIKDILGINLSPFSQYPSYTYIGRRDLNFPPYSDRDILNKLTARNHRISGSPKLMFNSGTTIANHQFLSSTVTRYLNYCINERGRVDHGIIGGMLFYDRMLKNYLVAYTTLSNEYAHAPNLEDFYYRDRHFCTEQLKIFSYISDCILSHNIWKQPNDKREEYERYGLTQLLGEHFRNISYESNPLLYILVVADTLEPLKIYQQANPNLRAEEIIDAIDIEYAPASRSLTISSNSSKIDISLMHSKADSLAEWTTAICSPLENSHFDITL